MRSLFACLLAITVAGWTVAWGQNATPGRKAKKPQQPDQYDASVPKPTLSEVKYGDHPRHVIDFWRAESDAPTPLVFVIHGGGWQGGTKERVHRFVDVNALLRAGISVAACNYRYVKQAVELGIEPPVRAPLHDAARAIQFVRSKSKEWAWTSNASVPLADRPVHVPVYGSPFTMTWPIRLATILSLASRRDSGARRSPAHKPHSTRSR